MKSIFILGGSRLQVPAIIKAKQEGLYVYVLDYDPKAVGIKYADKFLEISTLDKVAVLEAAEKYKPEYIITSTSDMPVRTVSWVCEKLGMRSGISYQGAIYATDKIEMRKRMRECQVPIPFFYEINSYDEFVGVIESIDSKFIIKPSDNSASRGVILVDKNKQPNYEEIYSYCKNYSRSGKVLVEEYLEGPEVSVESFSENGQHFIITITDKIVSELPFFVELGHTEPSRLSDVVQEEIKSVALAAINAIGMKDGPTHTEIKVTHDGPKLVEIAARLGGDYITSKLVPLSTGVNMINCEIFSSLGKKINIRKNKNNGAAIRFIHGINGKLDSIEGIDDALAVDGVEEVEIYSNSGSAIREPENSSDRIGHIIAIGVNAEEAANNADKALKKIKIKYM